MTKQFFWVKKSTLIEYSHLGTQHLQLTRQSTYHRNQVTSLPVKLKYQMSMNKFFPMHFSMVVPKEEYFLLYFVFFPIITAEQ